MTLEELKRLQEEVAAMLAELRGVKASLDEHFPIAFNEESNNAHQ